MLNEENVWLVIVEQVPLPGQGRLGNNHQHWGFLIPHHYEAQYAGIKEKEQEQGLRGRLVGWSIDQWLLPSTLLSLSRKNCDLASFGQVLYDLSLIICIMNTCFTELSRVAVLFPVVVPVPPAVCTKAKYIHLDIKQRTDEIIQYTLQILGFRNNSMYLMSNKCISR